MRQCKGICAYTFKAVYRQNNPIGFIGDANRRYCSVCACWTITDSILCPCCKTKMRTIPANNESRNKMIHVRY